MLFMVFLLLLLLPMLFLFVLLLLLLFLLLLLLLLFCLKKVLISFKIHELQRLRLRRHRRVFKLLANLQIEFTLKSQMKLEQHLSRFISVWRKLNLDLGHRLWHVLF